MSDIASGQWDAEGQRAMHEARQDQEICRAAGGEMSAPLWQKKPGKVQAVVLTGENAPLVAEWLSQHGVHASWGENPPRLSFGSRRGSYCTPPGYWIVLCTDGDRPGAEAWEDGAWQMAWTRAAP